MAQLFRRILVPYDFSEHADRALAVAAGLAATSRGRVTVLHAVPPFHPPPEVTAWLNPPDPLPGVRRQLEKVVKRVVGKKVPVACRAMVGDPLTSVMQAVRGADSIVMATRGRTGLAHLLIGSVAEKIVRHSPVPVLTVPAAGRRLARTRASGPSKRGRRRR